MKKVLQVIPCLELGGTEAYVMSHYRQLYKTIHFDFVAFSHQESVYSKEIEHLGGKVFCVGSPSLKTIFSAYKKYKQLIKAHGPYDIMHCHADAGNALPLLIGAMCGIKRRIAHAHSVNDPPEGIIMKCVLLFRQKLITSFATDFFACSTVAGETHFGQKRFKKKGVVCNNGICVNDFLHRDEKKIQELRKEFNINSENNLIVGNISRFDNNKNQAFILKVFQELLHTYPHAVLLLGGNDGGQLERIKIKAKNMGIEEQVRFIGKRTDVPQCLKIMDIHLFPSVHEGLGIALLEAQAAGCLCFASTGVPEVADLQLGNVTRLPLDLGSQAWSRIIIEKLLHRSKISNDVVRKAFVEKGFDIAECARRLEDLYEK